MYESGVWKRELERDASEFRRLISEPITEEDYEEQEFTFRTEKFFFLSAFIMRKLIESRKLSDEARAITVTATSYVRKTGYASDSISDYIRRYDFIECYDIDNPKYVNLSLQDVCNMIVHSFFFAISLEMDESGQYENGKSFIRGFFLSSDRTRERQVYYFSVEDYLGLVQSVVDDEVNYVFYNRIDGTQIRSRDPDRMGDELPREQSD